MLYDVWNKKITIKYEIFSGVMKRKLCVGFTRFRRIDEKK